MRRLAKGAEFTGLLQHLKEGRGETCSQKRTRSSGCLPQQVVPKRFRPVSEPVRQEASSSSVVTEPEEGSATPSLCSDEDMAGYNTPMSPKPARCQAPEPVPEPQAEAAVCPKQDKEPTWLGSPNPTPVGCPWPSPEPETSSGLRAEPITVVISTVFLGLGGGIYRLWTATIEVAVQRR